MVYHSSTPMGSAGSGAGGRGGGTGGGAAGGGAADAGIEGTVSGRKRDRVDPLPPTVEGLVSGGAGGHGAGSGGGSSGGGCSGGGSSGGSSSSRRRGSAAGGAAGGAAVETPPTVEELMVQLAAAKAARAAADIRTRKAVHNEGAAYAHAAAESRARVAAEARATSAEGDQMANAIEKLTLELLMFANAATSDVRGQTNGIGIGLAPVSPSPDVVTEPEPHVAHCGAALKTQCSGGVAEADQDAIKSAIRAAGVAKLALDLAHVDPKKRIEVLTAATAATPGGTVQGLFNAYMEAVVHALLPGARWATEVNLATAFFFGQDLHHFLARADGAVVCPPDTHANIVSVWLTAEQKGYLDEEVWASFAAGVGQSREQASLRVLHNLILKYYAVHPRPAALPAGRLAAYNLISDGFHLYVICVEVVYDAKSLPRLVCSRLGPLRLWSHALMDYAERREGAVAPALRDCYDAEAPGLVALVKLLRAGRDVLGDLAYTVPTGLAFGIPLPPSHEWGYLARGSRAELYSTVVADERFVVKIARHPASREQGLDAEVAAYTKLGAHACPAIPVLRCTAKSPDGLFTAALVLSAGGGGVETVPVEDRLSAEGDRIVHALVVVWSAVVALHHAHGACVVHCDVHSANIVWKVGAVLPTGREVAAAIAAAEAAAGAAGAAGGAGGSSGIVTAALGLLPPPPAQLVSWGKATAHGRRTTQFVDGAAADTQRLVAHLLPALVDPAATLQITARARITKRRGWYTDSVATLASRMRGRVAAVESHLDDLLAARSAAEAALPVLRLLYLALTSDPAAPVPAAVPAAAAAAAAALP